MSSAICSNLDQSKILSSGNGLKCIVKVNAKIPSTLSMTNKGFFYYNAFYKNVNVYYFSVYQVFAM